MPSHDHSPEARLIALYNEHYVRIFAAARAKGEDRITALQRDVASFFGGSTGLAEIFQDLSIATDGTLDREAVLANLDRIRATRKLQLLFQGLSELLDFLLFSAMEVLDASAAQALELQVSDILREGGESSGTSEPSVPTVEDPLGLIGELAVDEERGGVLDFEALAMRGSPDLLSIPSSMPGWPPDPPGDAPSVVPGVPFVMAPPFEALAALSAAEAGASFAIENLDQLARQLQDDSTREVVLRTIELVRGALREIGKAKQTLAPSASPRRRR